MIKIRTKTDKIEQKNVVFIRNGNSDGSNLNDGIALIDHNRDVNSENSNDNSNTVSHVCEDDSNSIITINPILK